MKRLGTGFFVAGLAAFGFATMGACEDSEGDDGDMTDDGTPDAAPAVDAMPVVDADPLAPDADLTPDTVDVTEDITVNTVWTYPDTYVLKQHVFVKNGATLTIEPGVVIKGEAMTSLVVTREGKLNAVGTAELPIVFTSAKPVGMRAPSDWGGVVLLGKADINDPTATELTIEGFPATAGADVRYGGSDDAHDCGKLKYARIEFAGFELEPTKELNALTVGACGTATEIDFVQTHKGSDDGIEMFGGTASLKHVVITQGQDDGLDWDMGWRGNAQFVIVQVGNDQGENGFECDNHPTSADTTPRSMPVIYNATIVGPDGPTGKKKFGMVYKNGSAGHIYNAVIMNVNGMAVDIRNAPTVAQFPANLFVKNSIFFGAGETADATDNDGGFDEAAQITNTPANNIRTADPQLTAPANLTAPSWKPMAGSPALTGAATPPGGFFDASATFVGAIGADDWTAGWTAFPQN